MSLSMKIRISAAAFLFAAALALPLGAETSVLSSLGEVRDYAREHSLEYRKAAWEAEKAYEAIESRLKVGKTSLVVTPSYQGGDFGFGASLNVPVVDQISVSAKTDQNLNSSVSVQANPLSHSSSYDLAEISYAQALAQAEDTAGKVETEAVKAVLGWMDLERQRTALASKVEVKQTAYDDAKKMYEYDGEAATLDDVRTALIELSEARNSLSKIEQSLGKSKASLYAYLGAGDAVTRVAALSLDSLSASVDALKASLAGAGTNPSESYSEMAARFIVDTISAKLRNTWLLEPDLSVSSGISLSKTGSLGITASISLGIGLDDLKTDSRKSLSKDLAFAKESLDSAKAANLFACEQARIAAESASEAKGKALLTVEQAAELQKETAFLAKAGEASVLEKELADLDYTVAENNLYSALVSEYSAWLDLQGYIAK